MRTILAVIILVTGSTIANGQNIRPLPQAVQNLSDENYVVWASWQNRQAAQRAEEILADTAWDKYRYMKRLSSNSFSRGNTMTRVGNSSQSSTQSGKGWSDRSGSRDGYADTNFNHQGGTVVTSRQVRYRNSGYVGAGAVITYNPWVRSKGALGNPDWDNLFVPTSKGGTLTLQEVLDQRFGPTNPEKVFKALMGVYFD